MRYGNWRELAKNCLESEMSVHGWCRANNIPPTTCRQWLARLKKEERWLGSKEQTGDVSIWGKVDFVQSDHPCTTLPFQPGYPPAIKLSYHSWSMEISADFDPLLLSRIMKVVESVC